MKTWHIYASVVGTKYLGKVKAETMEEAEEKAWGLDTAYVSVCHQCSHQIDSPEIEKIIAEEA